MRWKPLAATAICVMTLFPRMAAAHAPLPLTL